MQSAHSMASAGENWPRDALPQGTLLYGYRIEKILGRGGFGITYRALDRIEQSFALKECFPRQFAVRQGMEVLPADAEAAEGLRDCLSRFIREARALLQLSQRGAAGDTAVKVVTFFETNGTAYLVMEFLEGESLEQWIRATAGGIPEERLSGILQGVLHAVGSAHDAGLLHRDIKPSNILLRQDGRPVLIDFGAVRAVAGGGQTQTFTQIYSESYAPIEQITGGPQGPYSDLYALGATFYRAIGGTTVDALTRHVAAMSGKPDPLVPAAAIGAGRYRPALLAAIDAALRIPASERPQTVGDFLALLAARESEEGATRFAAPLSLEDTRTRVSPRPLSRAADGESRGQPASERAELRSPAGGAPVSPSTKSRESAARKPAPRRRIALFGTVAAAALALAIGFGYFGVRSWGPAFPPWRPAGVAPGKPLAPPSPLPQRPKPPSTKTASAEKPTPTPSPSSPAPPPSQPTRPASGRVSRPSPPPSSGQRAPIRPPARPGPQVASLPRETAPAPPPLARPDVEGKISGVFSATRFKVGKDWVELYGVAQLAQNQHIQTFIRDITPAKGRVACYRKTSQSDIPKYQCYTGGKDLALLELKEGIAEPDAHAPSAYKLAAQGQKAASDPTSRR